MTDEDKMTTFQSLYIDLISDDNTECRRNKIDCWNEALRMWKHDGIVHNYFGLSALLCTSILTYMEETGA